MLRRTGNKLMRLNPRVLTLQKRFGSYDGAQFPADKKPYTSHLEDMRRWNRKKPTTPEEIEIEKLHDKQGWETSWWLFTFGIPLFFSWLYMYGPSHNIHDWAREEALLTPEKPIVGRPQTEIYPDYDVYDDKAVKWNK